jgi:hypothetical protein
MEDLESRVHPLFHKIPAENGYKRPKIAVLDTGAKFDQRTRDQQYQKRLKECVTFYRSHQINDGDPLPSWVDEDGHGTHVTSLVLRVTRDCDVYAAQVFRTRNEMQDEQSSDEAGIRISRVRSQNAIIVEFLTE